MLVLILTIIGISALLGTGLVLFCCMRMAGLADQAIDHMVFPEPEAPPEAVRSAALLPAAQAH